MSEKIHPVAGMKYQCHTPQGVCIMRYGFHNSRDRKDRFDVPRGCGSKGKWTGWRDDKTGKFIRPERILKVERIGAL